MIPPTAFLIAESQTVQRLVASGQEIFCSYTKGRGSGRGRGKGKEKGEGKGKGKERGRGTGKGRGRGKGMGRGVKKRKIFFLKPHIFP